MSIFHALEVVDRGSETKPQVVENLNKLTYGYSSYASLVLVRETIFTFLSCQYH